MYHLEPPCPRKDVGSHCVFYFFLNECAQGNFLSRYRTFPPLHIPFYGELISTSLMPGILSSRWFFPRTCKYRNSFLLWAMIRSLQNARKQYTQRLATRSAANANVMADDDHLPWSGWSTPLPQTVHKKYFNLNRNNISFKQNKYFTQNILMNNALFYSNIIMNTKYQYRNQRNPANNVDNNTLLNFLIETLSNYKTYSVSMQIERG